MLGDSHLELANSDDGGTTNRRYSLRARQARQLNPYEYDKRLYKLQMKRLPDAIVKVVSPRRRHSGHARVRHNDGGEDDFVVTDDSDDESQVYAGQRPRRPSREIRSYTAQC